MYLVTTVPIIVMDDYFVVKMEILYEVEIVVESILTGLISFYTFEVKVFEEVFV